MTFYIINCQFENLSAVETKKCHKQRNNHITLNAAWKIGLRDHTGNIMSAAE
jgi:hypothetical protein